MSGAVTWPSTCSVDECSGPSKVPVGELTLTVVMMVRRSSMLSPYEVSARLFTRTRIALRLPPVSVTRPTPLIWLIFCASRVST